MLVGRGDLVHAAGEPARAAEVGLAHVAQFVAETPAVLGERRLILRPGRCPGPPRTSRRCRRAPAGRRRARRRCSRSPGPVERADRDRDRTDRPGAATVHSTCSMPSAPDSASNSSHSAPPSTNCPPAPTVRRARDSRGSATATTRRCPAMSEATSRTRAGRRRRAPRRRCHLGDRRPALPVAGREPAEVGVGVDPAAGLDVHRQPLAARRGTLDDGVEVLVHRRRRRREDASR